MDKKFLPLMLLILQAISVNAQSLEFIYKNNTLTDNEIVTVTDFIEDEEVGVEMTFSPILQNKTNNALKVVVRKEEISIPAGSFNTFCTGMGCYTTTTSSEYTIAANGNDPYFHCTFSPVITSTATIKYTASVVGTFNDNISVTVNYQYVPAGIETAGFRQLSVVQKKGLFLINYENTSNSFLRIFDMQGKMKSTYQLPKDKNMFSPENKLDKGIYLFVFTGYKGNSITKKLLVY